MGRDIVVTRDDELTEQDTISTVIYDAILEVIHALSSREIDIHTRSSGKVKGEESRVLFVVGCGVQSDS